MSEYATVNNVDVDELWSSGHNTHPHQTTSEIYWGVNLLTYLLTKLHVVSCRDTTQKTVNKSHVCRPRSAFPVISNSNMDHHQNCFSSSITVYIMKSLLSTFHQLSTTGSKAACHHVIITAQQQTTMQVSSWYIPYTSSH